MEARINFVIAERTCSMMIPREWFDTFNDSGERLRIHYKHMEWNVVDFQDLGFQWNDMPKFTEKDMKELLELIYVLFKSGFKIDEEIDGVMLNGFYNYDDFFFGNFGIGGSKIWEDTLRSYYAS